jgi:putative ABC transport system ATP-binding protein
VLGTSLGTLDESALAAWRGRQVGVVFQFFQLLPTLSVLENVMLPMDFCRTFSGSAARRRALELLERFGIADQAQKLPQSLSGGQQQRAAIARALANDPPLVVADEPTGNLDSHTAEAVMALLAELPGAGRSLVMVTHERDLAGVADRIITLADGKVVAQTLRAPQPARREACHA